MEFKLTPNRKTGSLPGGGNVNSSAVKKLKLKIENFGGCYLEFYETSPREDIGLEEFELLALDRLKLLRIFEKNSTGTGFHKYSTEWKERIEAEIKKSSLDFFNQTKSTQNNHLENRRKDVFSHHILRLAYSRSEELRRWFISQENDLFKFRFLSAGSFDLEECMRIHKLDFTPINDEEKSNLSNILNSCYAALYATPNCAYFKVHFTEALDLVKSRKVFVHQGYCYVPESEMGSFLTWTFKSLLQTNLSLTAKTLPNLDEDERLVKMLANLDKRYTGTDYTTSADGEDKITPNMIESLSEKNFPLCMKSAQVTLKGTHHLKYKARIQYGLFLKGIGLSLDDAIKFFRGEFSKGGVDPDKFEKEYVYSIRYNYGYEGKKVNWMPWNCMKIINDTVGPGENHGCPFRHHDPELVSKALGSNISDQEIKEVMQFVKNGHYQKACSAHFKSIFGYEITTGITNHPNQFYKESKGQIGSLKSHSKLKTEKVAIFNTNNN